MSSLRRVRVSILAAVVLASACTTGGAQPDDSPTVTAGPQTAEVAYPEEGSLIETMGWGEVPSNLIDVLLLEGSGLDEAEVVAEVLDGEVVGSIELISYFQIRIGSTTESDLTAALELALAQDGVEEAFPELPLFPASQASCTAQGPLQDSWFTAADTPADGKPFQAVGLEQAWAAVRAAGVGLTPVKVGVVDTALYTGSNEISGTVRIAGAKPGDSTDQPSRNGSGELSFGGLNHGTGVAHVIGADPSNGGMVGVASILGKNLSISVTDVFGGPPWTGPAANPADPTQATFPDGRSWTSATLAGILSQVEQGATVINLSLGANPPGDNNRPVAAAYRRLLEFAAKKYPRVVFVAAAGNDSVGINGWNQAPGGLPLPNLITVGAVASDGTSATFTNYAVDGGEVTIAAPGVGVPMGISPDGKPYHASGTSFSAPMVAGAVALLQSLNPELTPAQIKKILRETAATKVKGEKEVVIAADLGGRILRVDEAVLRVINETRAHGASPKPALAWEEIAALSALTATVESAESDTYTVTGLIGAVGDGGTDLVLSLLSEGSIAGDATQSLAAPGSALWLVVFDDGSGAVAVNRTDTGVGCSLSLEPEPIDGLWTGAMVVSSVDFLNGDEAEIDLGDGSTTLVTKEECEALVASSEQDPTPIEYSFATTSPGVGTVSGVTGGDEGGETGSGSWISTGDHISFEMAVPGQASTITFEGTVGETVIEGSWETSTEDLVIKGTFSMSRAGG